MRGVTIMITIFTFASLAIAQTDPACPTLSITGPMGIATLGASISFTAKIEGTADSSRLQYAWSISAGRILSGQGTASLRVDPQDREITATVEVSGFPAGCPAVASEYYGGDPAPEAEQIFTLTERRPFNDDIRQIVLNTVRDHPTDQIYVLAGVVVSGHSRWIRRQEGLLVDFAIRNKFHERLTIVRLDADVEILQAWRLPPGALNPVAFERERGLAPCPTILVSGPAGVVGPGESFTFSADLSEVPKFATYRWTVSDGDIIAGQGTTTMTARLRRDARVSTVTATITVTGFPLGCDASASETHSWIIDPGPELIGEVNSSTYTIPNRLLRKLRFELAEGQHDQLYVIVYLGSNENTLPAVRTLLLRQLLATKIDKSRITIVASPIEMHRLKFYAVPPGSLYDPVP